MNAAGQRLPDGSARLKSAEDRNRADRRFRQSGRDVGRDASEPDHLDLKALSGGDGSLEIGTAEMLKTERQRASRDGLPEHIGVLGELITNGRPHEVGAIRIEALLDQEVDVAEVDDAHVDGHLLGLAGSGLPCFRESVLNFCHLIGICMESN